MLISVSEWELTHLIDGLMVLMHDMEQIPENDLSEMPQLQALLDRLSTPKSNPEQEPESGVRVFGLCDNDSIHEAHFYSFALGTDGEITARCPGQFSECRNCDGRKCMDCVTRTIHDECVDDCPFCCVSP